MTERAGGLVPDLQGPTLGRWDSWRPTRCAKDFAGRAQSAGQRKKQAKEHGAGIRSIRAFFISGRCLKATGSSAAKEAFKASGAERTAPQKKRGSCVMSENLDVFDLFS